MIVERFQDDCRVKFRYLNRRWSYSLRKEIENNGLLGLIIKFSFGYTELQVFIDI